MFKKKKKRKETLAQNILSTPVTLSIVHMPVEKKLYLYPKNSLVSPRHIDLISLLGQVDTLQVSQIPKNKTELLIFLILVNGTSIHPAAYARNVGITPDTAIFLTHDIISLTMIQ